MLSPLPYVTDFMNYPTTADETVTFATGVVVAAGVVACGG